MQYNLNPEHTFPAEPVEIRPEIAQAVDVFMKQPQRRFLFGATPYAEGIASLISVQAVIDDRVTAAEFNGLPVLRSDDIPANAVVIATTLGRPASARRHLQSRGITHADYFAFHRLCNLPLPYARFWTDFTAAVECDRTSGQHQVGIALTP
jgi:hypothetical protein